MGIEEITDKKSIADWVQGQSRLNGLGKGAKEEIINNMWKAYQWLTNGGA
jgi:hypothetical protein